MKPASFQVAAVIFVIIAAFTIAAPAQTFKTVVEFNGTNEGGNLLAPLTQGPDGNYYGATQYDGSDDCNQVPGCGTIFKVSPQGNLTTLYTFCMEQPCTDGGSPWAGLLLGTDGDFYGTTYEGGAPNTGEGTVFKVTPAGKLTTLHRFCAEPGCLDGAQPTGQLIQGADGNFYGTTRTGGDNQYCPLGCGTVFRITLDGAFTSLYAFTYIGGDGAIPSAGLTLGPDGSFYGTTSQGGNPGLWCTEYLGEYGCGTVFRITSAGRETVLYHFCQDENFCATDGALPFAGLVLGNDGSFYGAAWGGGGSDQSGALFRITPQGHFTELYQFCSLSDCSDGALPGGTLIQGTDGALYGTTEEGGSTSCFGVGVGCGTAFRYTPEGGLTTLYTFQRTGDWSPFAGLTQTTRGYFLGTTYSGGTSGNCFADWGCGVVYSISTGLTPFVTFVQSFGKVGQTGQILGQGFTGTTGVELNGVSASFTVVSPTFIRFTVPEGATSGTVTVTTPTGKLLGNVPFTITP